VDVKVGESRQTEQRGKEKIEDRNSLESDRAAGWRILVAGRQLIFCHLARSDLLSTADWALVRNFPESFAVMQSHSKGFSRSGSSLTR
jgi:hypothetical protein